MLFASPAQIYGLGFAFIAVTLAVSIVRFVLSTRRPKDFPPGPKTILGLGNLHQIPPKAPFLQFTEWSRTFGDVIGLKTGPTNLVVLNSAKAIHDLLSKRGAIYSGRPTHYIANEYVYKNHKDKHMLAVGNSSYLRWQRTNINPFFNSKVPEGGILDVQNATSTKLVYNILQNPVAGNGGFAKHISRWAMEAPLLTIAGDHNDDGSEEAVSTYFKTQAVWLELLDPGATPPVDVFPILNWVPEALAEWKRKARLVHEHMATAYTRYLNSARRSCVSASEKDDGKDSPKFRSLIARLSEKNKEQSADKRVTDDDLSFLAGSILDAAVNTTWAAIMSMILHMAAFPEIQAKAREEIDRVSDGFPVGQTIQELPYLRACLLELLRYRPVAPLGLPRKLDQDDNYREYVIPENTTVLANIWAIGHDPDLYDEPSKFDPERFVRHPHGLKDGADVSEAASKTTYAFGAGRRVCAGEQFARNSILLAISKLLWTFEIVPVHGEKLDLSLNGYFMALDVRPKPFNVEFRLRGEKQRAAVLEGFDRASEVIKAI